MPHKPSTLYYTPFLPMQIILAEKAEVFIQQQYCPKIRTSPHFTLSTTAAALVCDSFVTVFFKSGHTQTVHFSKDCIRKSMKEVYAFTR